LALSILLVLFKFVCVRREQLLLAAVDKRVSEELLPRFGRTANSSLSQIEELRQLTQSVVQATEKLTQHFESPARASPVHNGKRPTEADDQKMEEIVARAMSNALQRQTSTTGASSTGSVDFSAWKPLQQVLQQLANFFSGQQTKQEDEGRVVQQLLEIIDEGLRDKHAPKRPLGTRLHSDEATIPGVWK
jgi:hypothetical protein